MRTELYQRYITDAVWVIPHNKMLEKKFSEILGTSKCDERTGDEIAAEVIKKAGLTLK